MKILRVRRGYTTNSSGSNEWVPPKHLKLMTDGGTGDAAEGFSVRVLSGQGASKWSADSQQVTILATDPGTRSTQTEPVRPNAIPGRSTTNLGLVGLVVGAVCLLFVGTGLLRRLFIKKRHRDGGK